MVEDVYPLSDIQAGMVYHSLKDIKSGVYHNQQIYFLKHDNFSYDNFEKALGLLANKHSILRTGFDYNEYKEPIQKVYKTIKLNIEHFDLTEKNSKEQRNLIENILAFDREKSFSIIGKPPLWRIKTFKVKSNSICMVFIFHHAIIDGWSCALFLMELKDTYLNLLEDSDFKLFNLKSTYKDYIVDQLLEKKNIGGKKFWKEELKNLKKVDFGYESDTAGLSGNKFLHKKLPVTLFNNLSQFAAKNETTLKNVCLSAYIYTLNMISYENDITIGLVTNNRPVSDDGDKLIGCFLNTIPFRIKIQKGFTPVELIKVVDKKLNQTALYDRMSLHTIQREIYEQENQKVIFNSIFNYMDFYIYKDNSFLEQGESEKNELTEMEGHVNTDTLLDFNVNTTSGEFSFAMYYDDNIDNSLIKELAVYYERILKYFLVSPNNKLNTEFFLSKKIQQGEVEKHKNPYNINEIHTIQQLFNKVGNELNDKIAYVINDKHYTYSEIEGKANALAIVLKNYGVEHNTLVGVLMEREINCIITIFAIIKAGGAYIPINDNYPENRIKYILNDSNASLLIVSKKFLDSSEKILWELISLNTCICIESDISGNVSFSEFDRSNSMFWDRVNQQANNKIAASGWINSYTHKPFSCEEMNELYENVITKVTPLINNQSKVLEVGCGQGEIMLALKGLVKLYVATDVSQETTDELKATVSLNQYNNVEVYCLSALGVEKLKKNSFDIIIVNSVVQYFPSFQYFKQFLQIICNLLSDDGYIFLGDLRNKELQKDYYLSLQNMEEYPKSFIENKISNEPELFIHKQFLKDFFSKIEYANTIHISEKKGTINNELKKYRFDALIQLTKSEKNINTNVPIKQIEFINLQHLNNERFLFDSSKTDPIYVMYTSGSTGRPKGVVIENKNVASFAKALFSNYEIKQGDIIYAITTYAFDISVLELICSYINGVKVIFEKDEKNITPQDINHKVVCENVNVLQITPSRLQLLLHEIDENFTKRLDILLVGGEAMSNELYEQISKEESCKVFNVYGPTETTIWSSSKKINQEKLTIGKASKGEVLSIISANEQKIPLSKRGEILIAGEGVGRGYLNLPQLTYNKFITESNGLKAYKTGDLGFEDDKYDFNFISRIDNQIKIRGFRIEINEIEDCLNKHQDVKNAVVNVFENSNNKLLCAYLVINHAGKLKEIRNYLELLLPDYMIPSSWVVLDKLPINNNGKIDRKALPNPLKQTIGNKKPSCQISIGLAEIWSEILSINKDFIYENSTFLELGGHSLNIIGLISKIKKRFNISLPPSFIFKNNTLKQLAEVINSYDSNSYKEIKAIEKQEYYSVSSEQKGMYLYNQVYPNSLEFNMPSVFVIEGHIDIEKWQQILNNIIIRHDILRISFFYHNERIVQKPYAKCNLTIQHSNIKKEDFETKLREFKKPFDLKEPPLFRASILSFNKKFHYLLLDMHHIISDAQTFELIIAEFIEEFNGNEIQKQSIQYIDYARWQKGFQNSPAFLKMEDYWLKKLKGMTITQLPHDRTSENEDGKGCINFEIGKELLKIIDTVCVNHNITRFHLLLSIFKFTISAETRSEDISIGIPVSNRDNPYTEKMIGMLINTLVVRSKLKSNDTVISNIKNISKNVIEDFENKMYAYELLNDKIHALNRVENQELFTILFNYQNYNPGKETSLPFKIHEYEEDKYNPIYDLSVRIIENAQNLKLKFIYNSNKLSKFRIERIKLNFETYIKKLLIIEAYSLTDILNQYLDNRQSINLEIDNLFENIDSF